MAAVLLFWNTNMAAVKRHMKTFCIVSSLYSFLFIALQLFKNCCCHNLSLNIDLSVFAIAWAWNQLHVISYDVYGDENKILSASQGSERKGNDQPLPLRSKRVSYFESKRCCVDFVVQILVVYTWVQLFEGWLALNSGLNLTRVSFRLFKSIFSDNFLCSLLEFPIINLYTKRIEIEMLFKVSNLNSNLALTPDYLNPALKNWALGFKFSDLTLESNPASLTLKRPGHKVHQCKRA